MKNASLLIVCFIPLLTNNHGIAFVYFGFVFWSFGRHYSEDICVLDATSEQALTKPSCPYLAEKCLDQQSFHFLHSGPCRTGTDVSWAKERLRIATDSIKREACGYDTCYDWEQCSGTQLCMDALTCYCSWTMFMKSD